VLGGGIGATIELVELSKDFPQARLVYSGLGNGTVVEYLPASAVIEAALLWKTDHETHLRTRFISKELIKPKAEERWLVVTAASHIPRAIGCFRRVGFKVEAYPILYTQSGIGPSSVVLSEFDTAMKE
jgi:uncharacterized SAM-binding protein YcdF (DUF218 family)